jgi:cell division protein FtsB
MSEPRRNRSQPSRRPSAASRGSGKGATARRATKSKKTATRPAAKGSKTATRPAAKGSKTTSRPADRKKATTRPADRKKATSRPAEPGRKARGGRLRRVARGDRPFMAGLVVVLVLVVTMALGPLQNYTAAADRVEALESTRDQLRQQVDALEDRRTLMQDPEELELIARTELGLVMPGEVPFVVVTPNDEEYEQVRPEPPAVEPSGDVPWYRRLGRSLQDLFTADS